MGSLASGQPFQLALQSLFLVLDYCLCFSLSNSSLMGSIFFLIMGKKGNQLFTVDCLWLGYYFVFNWLLFTCMFFMTNSKKSIYEYANYIVDRKLADLSTDAPGIDKYI